MSQAIDQSALVQVMPVLPLRDVVLFPYMVTPIYVGRAESIAALEAAVAGDKQIFLLAQRDKDTDHPVEEELYDVGTVATILQIMRLGDSTVKLLVEGLERATLYSLKRDKGYIEAVIEREKSQVLSEYSSQERLVLERLRQDLLKNVEKLIAVNDRIPAEMLSTLQGISEPARLTDSIAAQLDIKIHQRQKLLSQPDLINRMQELSELLLVEVSVIKNRRHIAEEVKAHFSREQQAAWYREEIRQLHEALSKLEGRSSLDDGEMLQQQVRDSAMPDEVKEKALKECHRLQLMPAMSAEANVCRHYVETLLELPWKKKSRQRKDCIKAKEILDHDHYGLKEVKERVLEYLAVQSRVKKPKGSIICFVGPPGVGKTSLGQSIADATGRVFARISLGGVGDHSQIRGHRRTYIGSMPGKIIQTMAKVGVINPLIMLDEIDKLVADYRGDPASALLEVLDPEQNHAFSDHFLEVDYDLSHVMFIATSNSMNIPEALLDRMEVIRISGYTDLEKASIAGQYLCPKQLAFAGLKPQECQFSTCGIEHMIRFYTREAGVRQLERAISKVCRKVVYQISTGEQAAVVLTKDSVGSFLGVEQYRSSQVKEDEHVGQVTGLAWTRVGGELLTIEVQMMPGKGKVIQTGSLGDVMQESISAALTLARVMAHRAGLKHVPVSGLDIHVHVPEGATPKDGPSAGIALCTAIVSSLSGIPVKSKLAMTGEVTLSGDVLAIGGLKEKLLAAYQGGVTTVLIPQDNAAELEEVPELVTQSLTIIPVSTVDQVLSHALVTALPEPASPQSFYFDIPSLSRCDKPSAPDAL